jgi:peptidoglycan hydrolase-like protein with peptidoglycan-binding domain
MAKHRVRKPKQSPQSVSRKPERSPTPDIEDSTPDQGKMSVEHLHRLVGNAAVQRLMSGGQLQLTSPSHFLLNKPRPKSIQRTINSPRFSGNEDIKKADEGKDYIKFGDKGQEVVRIQQALVDAGYKLPKFGVDGDFRDETKAAVIQFQKDQGFSKEDQDGVVGPQTMTALSKHFEGYKVEAVVAKGQTSPTKPTNTEFALGSAPPELLTGTRSLSADDKAAVTQAISTEQTVDPKTGKLPTFKKDNPAPGYEARVRKAVNDEIDQQFNSMAKGKADLRKDSKNLHDWSDFKGPSDQAKDVTDKVFGNYAQRPALTPGVNLFDRWETIENQIKADPSRTKGMAEWRVRKIVEESDGDVAQIDKEHGAIQSRPEENKIIEDIIKDIAAKREAELVEIHKGWPGSAGNGSIQMQRFKATTDAGRRKNMWRIFATIIHEYIHLLEHSNHVKYREGLDDQKGGKVLREGVPDYFKNVVWNDINFSDMALHKAVEGPYHDPANPTDPKDIKFGGKYGEAEGAERMAGIVGVRNVMAAFFLGHVDLIGGPSGKVP